MPVQRCPKLLLYIEGRAGYYDSAGALRDIIQNHLLQLLCLVAMESPSSFDERGFRDRKVDVLRAVRKPSAAEVREHTIRARYTAGRARGEDVPNYVDEPGVRAERQTETFAQVVLWIDNWTGKALTRDRRNTLVCYWMCLKRMLRFRFGAMRRKNVGASSNRFWSSGLKKQYLSWIIQRVRRDRNDRLTAHEVDTPGAS